MRELQVLLPMAGLGSRFSKAGFKLPKPLIPVDGMPMFQKALSSLDEIRAVKKYYFVIRQEHVDSQKLDQLIKQVLPEANIVVIPELTRGATETALAAASQLNPKNGLIIMDCDLWFKSATYNQMVELSLGNKSSISGGMLTFLASNPRYSYAKIDEMGMVTETAEKKVISNHAITGAYYFATASIFIESARKLLSQPLGETMLEYYLSILYNILINDGKKVQATEVNDFASFGTPEELEEYQGSHK